MIVVTAAEMQAMDRKTIDEIGIPGRVLMENAGRGATRAFLEHIYQNGDRPVGVLAGRGNNGGDGLVMARYLAQMGVDVRIFLTSTRDRLQGDAAANDRLLTALNIPVTEIPDAAGFADCQGGMRHCGYWIDALFGTGLNSDVRGYLRDVIQFVNQLQKPLLAVDIPSGLHSDTGHPCGICIQATVTATFGHPKIGHLLQPGAGFCGRVVLIDIGIPPLITQWADPQQRLITGRAVRRWLPQRASDSHKGRTGHLLVVAGATGKTGAAIMSTQAALRVGAGLVTLAAPQSLNPVLENRLIEAMTWPVPDNGQGKWTPEAFAAIYQAAMDKRCIAIGPGMGTSAAARDLVRRVASALDLPLVIDADGLNNLVGGLAVLAGRSAPTILTPHPGEMARLLDQSVAAVQHDRMAAARRLARQTRSHVILKGARSLVADPDGKVWINPTGNAGMASGGMGDVLTGAVAGLLAQGLTPSEAAGAAVFLHGLSADLLSEEASRGYLATEVMDALPLAIQRVFDNPPAPPVEQPLL